MSSIIICCFVSQLSKPFPIGYKLLTDGIINDILYHEPLTSEILLTMLIALDIEMGDKCNLCILYFFYFEFFFCENHSCFWFICF